MRIKSIAALCGLILSVFVAPSPLRAQTFTVLHNFTNTPDGAYPGGLVLGGGMLLGTTGSGGGSGSGSLFAYTNGGPVTVLHSFTNTPDGAGPNALLLSSNVLYGSTRIGGTNSNGAVFKVNTNGAGYVVLHSFTNTPDGSQPLTRLVTDGTLLYGTTELGGSAGGGTVFRMMTNGSGYTVLHSFTNRPDGANPYGALVLSGTNLYGTTVSGGQYTNGTIFKLATNGAAFSVIYNFSNAPDGAYPESDLLLVSNLLYGTTSQGGRSNSGTLFRLATTGSNYVVLHNFTGITSAATNSDGGTPKGSLIFNGGLLYGEASAGGSGNGGTVFEINTNGTGFAVIWNFNAATDGEFPQAGLVMNSSNTLFGTGYFGGSAANGTLFSLLLSPVITGQPQNLSVSNGFPASFTVTATDGSAINYQWYFNTNTVLAGQTNSTLSFAGVATTNAGNYTVVVADNFGSVTSSPAVLTVLSPNSLPAITAQPQGMTVSNGVVVSFSVTAIGQSPLKYFWYFNTNSANSNLVGNVVAGATNTTLTFTSATNSGGYYYAVITNSLGKATSNPALLIVISKPIITLQPQSVTVTNGNHFSFTAGATGAGVLGFQWYFQTNTLLPSATNTTLSFTNAITNLVGSYSMVASNTYGKATSSYAFLLLSNRPNLLSFVFNPSNGSFSFAYANTSKSTNRLWATTNLVATNFWRAIATNVMATNGLWFFTDTNTARTNNARFYRFSTP